MKKLTIFLVLVLMISFTSYAQSFRGLDKSPLDNAYFPDNFAHDRKSGDKAVIRVTYSRPQKKERKVFGGIVSYDEVWRTGANEATEIRLYQDVKFGDKMLKAGRYSLFTIPGEKEWTIIFNADLDYWGAYSYKPENDVLRISAQFEIIKESVEAFTIQFDKKDEGTAVMKFIWDKTLVEVPYSY